MLKVPALLDFTPVATTELVIFANLQSEFAERNVKFVVVSTQNRPSSDGGYVPHSEWLKDINEIYPNPDPHAVRFPLVTDTDGKLSYLYDMWAMISSSCKLRTHYLTRRTAWI